MIKGQNFFMIKNDLDINEHIFYILSAITTSVPCLNLTLGLSGGTIWFIIQIFNRDVLHEFICFLNQIPVLNKNNRGKYHTPSVTFSSLIPHDVWPFHSRTKRCPPLVFTVFILIVSSGSVW